MKFLWLIILCIPSLVYAQEKGIQFEQFRNWTQVKEQAKEKNKIIFLECFATWCGPCKLMDSEVFSDKVVGGIFNDSFISIKVQIDTSKKDADFVKNWYGDARDIVKKYNVSAVPTFLFFSPYGDLIYKETGARKVSDFLRIEKEVYKYYSSLMKYEHGEKDYSVMPFLARNARNIKDFKKADSIAQDYISNYLLGLSNFDLLKKANVEFIGSFLTSKSAGFNLFYNHSKEIDSVTRKDYAQDRIDQVITNEETIPELRLISKKDPCGNPDWLKIQNRITKKFNSDYAKRNLINAQIRWYNYKKDWEKVAYFSVMKLEKYGLDTSGFNLDFINNMLFEVVFKHSINRETLAKALKWQKAIVTIHPKDTEAIDTYSNLLYKLNRRKDALIWEKKALSFKPNDPDISETYEKMQRGVKTW